MKLLPPLSITLILFCSAGCLPSLLSKEEASDYFSEGFISPHCYQVLINRKPSQNTSSLIDSRESAYYQAKEEIQREAEKSLIDYTLKKTCGISEGVKDQDAIKNIDLVYLKEETKSYLRSGSIAEEYYQKDKSVVLVYRITKRNLQNRIASIKCKKIKSNVTGE